MRFVRSVCLPALLVASTLASAQSTPVSDPSAWVGAWATAPYGGDPWHTVPTLIDSTLRQIVHTSLAGKALRVRLTNEFGSEPLRIDAATVALSVGADAIQPQTLHALV